MTTIAILHSTVRTEEKRLVRAARELNVNPKLIDIRREIFNPETYKGGFDIALQRSVSTVKGAYATSFMESLGITVLNSSNVSSICENKYFTSLRLVESHIPIPKFSLVFDIDCAIQAVEELGGFPVVIKPASGSWGRLLCKVNDGDALEALLEHKIILGSPAQKAFYIQEYIDKKGRDIRVFMAGNEPICAIYRQSEHWITNTAKGADVRNCPVTPELAQISGDTSKAIGGGLLAIDIFETEHGYKVNEVNHTMEFKNSENPTGVDIAGRIIHFCLAETGRRMPKTFHNLGGLS